MNTKDKIKVVVCGPTSDQLNRVAMAMKDRADIVVIDGIPHLPIHCSSPADVHLFNEIPFIKKQNEGRRFDGTPKKRWRR